MRSSWCTRGRGESSILYKTKNLEIVSQDFNWYNLTRDCGGGAGVAARCVGRAVSQQVDLKGGEKKSGATRRDRFSPEGRGWWGVAGGWCGGFGNRLVCSTQEKGMGIN